MAPALNNQAKTAAASFLLFCLSLFSTAYSARNPHISGIGFAVISEIQRPFQIAADRVFSMFRSVWQGYINLYGAKIENAELQNRVAQLESLNSQLLEVKEENVRLREMLNIVEERKFKAVAASVIGFDAMSFSGSIVLDRGTRHGVRVEMPVLQGDHVVGQISATSPHSSKALLITDPSSAVDAIIQSSRVRGVVRGLNRANIADLQYVPPEVEVKVNDRLITSGMDRIFPKGLLIGTVLEVNEDLGSLFQQVLIKPAADFHKLESVLIITESSAAQYSAANE